VGNDRAPTDGSTDGLVGTDAVILFHGLADPTRLAILHHLRLGEHRVKDLVEHLGLAQSTVSAHLICLRGCGLVTSRPDGRASYFALSVGPELVGVFAAVKQLLGLVGDSIRACPSNPRR
jgi:ArsR family transcriptional regulator, cadmium/lead-responsive transcriptional repressor